MRNVSRYRLADMTALSRQEKLATSPLVAKWGFDSHHLHQIEKTALCGLFYLAKIDGREKPYERISSLHSKARVSAPRDILFALAEPATRGRGSIPNIKVFKLSFPHYY